MSDPNTALRDHDRGKAARILAAAENLVSKRGLKGITIAEIAAKAQVGKGTVYLYWRTKEDLFLELVARSFLANLDELVTEVRETAELARPERLCPTLVHRVLRRPLMRAIQTSDCEILGALADDPRTHEFVERHSAAALIRRLLPIWRRHGAARNDWDVDRQSYALQLLTIGFLQTTATSRIPNTQLDLQARDETITAAIQQLLRPDTVTTTRAADVEVEEVVHALEQAAEDLRRLVDEGS